MTTRLGALCAAGVSALVVLTAGPAAADPWEGIWAHEAAHCRYRVGETDGSPERLTRKEFVFYEGACDVKKVAPMPGVRAWIADLRCFSEGDRFDRREVLMLTGDGKLARFTSNGYLSEMVRCP